MLKLVGRYPKPSGRGNPPYTPYSVLKGRGIVRNRPLYVKMYVNKEELDKINDMYKKSGANSREEYLRAIVFSTNENKMIVKDKEKLEAIDKLRWEIKKIGLNINQIARHCNEITAVSPADIRDLRDLLGKISKMVTDYIDLNKL